MGFAPYLHRTGCRGCTQLRGLGRTQSSCSFGRASRFKQDRTNNTSAVDFHFTKLLTGSQSFTMCHGGASFAPLADMQSNAAAASIHLRPSLLVHVAEPMRRLITRWADTRARKFRRELDL